MVLRTEDSRRELSPWTYTWADGQGEFCAITHADGFPDYKRPRAEWRPRERVEVRFWKRQKPSAVKIEAWRRVDEQGLPVGPGRRLDRRLRKRTVSGKTIWAAIFAAPPRWRHVYVNVRGSWPDVQGCDTRQSLNAAFHLRPVA